MRPRHAWAAVVLLISAGCALIPEEPPAAPDPDDIETFLASVGDRLELHEWQSLLASSDPGLYQTEVVESETPEPAFLAGLFGLTEPENTVQEGDTLEWEDLDRIVEAVLGPPEATGGDFRVRGYVTLATGEELDLETWITRVQGRFVLTARP